MPSTLENLIFRLSIRAHRGPGRSELSHRAATFSAERYRDWRRSDLIQQYDGSFDWSQIEGRDVLDFGCGLGELSAAHAAHGARRVIAVDLSWDSIEEARKSVANAAIESAWRPTPAASTCPMTAPM